MGDLSDERIEPARQLVNTGVDYCGPLLIRDGIRKRAAKIKERKRDGHGYRLPSLSADTIKREGENGCLTYSEAREDQADATTISECLHSFCRSCIIQFLQENSHCPICEVIINKAKPNIKLDKTLQDIVYKLVPELFLREMARRQKFYGQHPALAVKVTPEERGEDTERTIFNPKDLISLSIEYISDDSTPGAITVPAPLDNASKNSKSCDNNDSQIRRFLQCPGMCRIEVLKKFVQNKYNVNTVLFHIEILYKRVPLPNHYTLIDIAYIYSWKRNEPMKFFFRIMEKSAVEKIEAGEYTITEDIFVKPAKPCRNSEKTKSYRGQSKKKATSTSNAEKKLDADKNDVIINTDKIKDEIKNKLQDIGNGPVYTNITLNRSNNVEIITKVQKVSNKNGQPIGLNIIKQTVKKTNRLNEKANSIKDERLADKPTQVTNGCKPDVRLNTENIMRNEQTDTKLSQKSSKKDHVVDKKEKKDLTNKEDHGGVNLEQKQSPTRVVCAQKDSKQDNLKEPKQNPSSLESESKNISPTSINRLEPSREIPKVNHEVDTTPTRKENLNKQMDNKENRKNKSQHQSKAEASSKKEETSLKLVVNQEIDHKEDNNVVIQTVLKKKDFDIDEEKSNFLKSIELTARTALQTIQRLKPAEKPSMIISNSPTIPNLNPKPPQKRKNSSPIKNDKKKSKKTKNSPVKLLPKLPAPPGDKTVLLSEKQKNGGDLQSLFSSCKINIPSSLSITLKESSEDDRDRRNAASLKPVQNYIEILKLPDSNQLDGARNDVDNRFKSKSTPNLPCKVSLTGGKDGVKQQLHTFQKMFEDSIKKIEPTEDGNQISANKRNLMEIASQLHKKTKLEVEKPAQKTENLPKVPIPRLSSQKKVAVSNSKGNQMKFQQTFANLHSASLGLNYTVSVAQNSSKSSGKIEAKVENSLKTPPMAEEVRNTIETKVEEAQNLIKKDEKSLENKTKPLCLPILQTFPSQSPVLNKKNSPANSPRSNSSRIAQPPIRQPNLNLSPRPPNLSPRPNMSPIPNIPSPRGKVSPEKPPANSGTSQNHPFSPNHILEKYNIQNLAQLTASLNFNSAVFGMNHPSQLAALQQAMLLKKFELHNRQNWQLSSQYEKYLQNRLLSKEN
ncbi:hypothetical protein Trydic_g2299 [Trypoxylus dichotomus]